MAKRSDPKSPRQKKADGPGKGGRRIGAGKPLFRPTAEMRKTVETLCGLGMRQDEIVLLVENPKTGKPIDLKTLRRHFPRELETGHLKANAKVAESLYSQAVKSGNVTAQIFWLKVRSGWKETVTIEAEIKSGVLVAPGTISPEAWVAAAVARGKDKREPGADGDDAG
jgi:hypothetical protein